MNTLKNHLSLVLALVTMLFALQTVISLQGIIKEYESNIATEYAMILVSKEELTLEKVRYLSYMVDSLEPIDATHMIESFKGNLTENNQRKLVEALPHFYRVKLNKYPSAKELKNIVESLKRNTNITKIESFAKTQNSLYSVLLLSKTILTIFSALIFIIASLLVVRQMEVWRFRHSERMQIMAIFGAALWLRSAVLYRLAIIDSIVSTFLVAGIFTFFSHDTKTRAFLNDLGLGGIRYDFQNDSLLLFGIAIAISVGSVIYVIVKADEEVR